MKICPACNESFSDEYSFCEIDGTKLKRQLDAANPAAAKKDWSLLGIALVLGAVLITGASIIFTPKARVAPPLTPSESLAVTTPQAGTAAAAVPDTLVAASSDPSSAAGEDGASILPDAALTAEVKKKEKPTKTDSAETEAANPKAAAMEPDAAAKTAKEVVQPAEQPAPAKLESDAKDAREADARSRVVTSPTTETKEVAKPPAAKASDKDADAKKKEEKKKKGGFFGVFKKIFGKDNKDNKDN